eukprot:7324566-Alexandrium_andersonii.AAC.1
MSGTRCPHAARACAQGHRAKHLWQRSGVQLRWSQCKLEQTLAGRPGQWARGHGGWKWPCAPLVPVCAGVHAH